MNVEGILAQLAAALAALVLGPLLTGWVNQWRAWLQSRARAKSPTSAIASAAGASGRLVDSVGMIIEASSMQLNTT